MQDSFEELFLIVEMPQANIDISALIIVKPEFYYQTKTLT